MSAAPRFFRLPLLTAGAALLSLLLSSCAVMTPNECKTANWRDVGLRDGIAGEPLSVLNDRTRVCADAGVQVAAVPYLEGRNQGLLSYCRIENAVRLGLDGKTYHGVCPPAIDGEFRRRYAAGRDVHDARAALRGLDDRRRALEHRLREAGNDEERRRLREDLSDLDRGLARARDRLRDAEWTLDRLGR